MIAAMTQAVINVAKHFSRFPAGRYREDGPSTGQRFREDMLIPALEQNEEVLVELDGVVGYGSSFLEEAFGGLVRTGKFSAAELHKKLKLHTKLKSIELEIWDYVDHVA